MLRLLLTTLSCVLTLIVPIEAFAQFASPTVVFAQESEGNCNIRYWHEFASEAVILARTEACPDTLFVDRRRKRVLLVDGDYIRVLRFYPAAELDPVQLPSRDHSEWFAKMDPEPDQHKGYGQISESLQVKGIRYLDNGSLGLLMSLAMPGGDASYSLLFEQSEGVWSVAALRWCGGRGCPEPVDVSDPFHPNLYLSTRDSRSWSEERMVWHPTLLYSEFVTYRNEAKYERSPGIFDGSIFEIGFRIDGEESVLTTYVSPSAHSDTLHTFGIELSVGTDPPINLSRNQCLTSIAGKHIIVEEYFGGRFEITDLATGETVFSDLTTAGWID